jgi:prepilin-type N-terminal cleavage/methylation domain-containing protein
MHSTYRAERGFTLIELSIVIVIIGLIVGGVLVGQSLIAAAAVRAQITQIEKYNTAVNTFRGKYNVLPGDMGYTNAAAFGFALGVSLYTRGASGQGDENGLIEGTGSFGSPSATQGYHVGAGEPVTFWSDLTYANGMNLNLIEGSFNAQGSTDPAWGCVASACGNAGGTTNSAVIAEAWPAAKIGGGNFVYAYSANSTNYYGLSVITGAQFGDIASSLGLSVQQAYAIDVKTDDGFPLTGHVIAQYVPSRSAWAGTASSSVAVTGSPTTCYDNAGSTANPVTYSTAQNSGITSNCALSFQFQ